MKIFKFTLHSIVDVITNSSTVIYTYQDGCEKPAKELINEMLKLSGETEKKADDIFYFGVFCDTEKYLEYISENDDDENTENCPKTSGSWGSDERKESEAIQEKWFNELQLSIMKGEVEKPKWMENTEEPGRYSEWKPSTYLVMVPKEEKYTEFGVKISKLLSGVEADGGRDG